MVVTGAAGFIGNALSRALIAAGHEVLGIDNMDPYYDIRLKEGRLKLLEDEKSFEFKKIDIADREAFPDAVADFKPDVLINLAAQAGVRYSTEKPFAYADANLYGFLNVLEICRHQNIKHLVYASTSSVYGLNEKFPFDEKLATEHPASLYAASKKANEMMAHSYSSMFGVPTTGLRFFTVYGPWGRPDMALFIFTKKILAGEPIDIFNYGKHSRDFTYVDDIVAGVKAVAEGQPPKGDESWNSEAPRSDRSKAPYQIFNIGNSKPVALMDFIETLEENLGKKAKQNMLPMQPGDIEKTWADVSSLSKAYGYQPTTSVKEGVKNFVAWYREFYEV